jgi:predicted XRE-type DNA-binding protein
MIKKSSKNSLGVYEGSGNIFEDLNIPDAAENELKAQLAMQLNQVIESLQCSQSEVAKRLGVKQPQVSLIANYKLQGFSAERLMQFLVSLGRSLTIQISAESVQQPRIEVVTEKLVDQESCVQDVVTALPTAWLLREVHKFVVLSGDRDSPFEDSLDHRLPVVERRTASFSASQRIRLQ